jgi:hypothetical protein
LLALVDGKFVNLRVPYPLGFYAKWLDGRIDNPKAGWKGKGLWSTTGTRTPFPMEGGKGTKPKVVKFQLRPDPLANSQRSYEIYGTYVAVNHRRMPAPLFVALPVFSSVVASEEGRCNENDQTGLLPVGRARDFLVCVTGSLE